jgi:plastocyanin
MCKSSPRFILSLCAALVVACRIDSTVRPEPPRLELPRQESPREELPRQVLARIVVAPDAMVLALDSVVALTLDAWDQSGASMRQTYPRELADDATWVSDDPKIATVDGTGTVTAVAPGVARISATLSLSGVSISASMTTEVVPPSDSVFTVTSTPDHRWSPTTVRVRAGGTVTWVIPNGLKPPTIWLNVWEKNPEELVFTDGVATHTFPERGTYYYGTGGGLMWYEEGGRIVVY